MILNGTGVNNETFNEVGVFGSILGSLSIPSLSILYIYMIYCATKSQADKLQGSE